MPSSKRHRLKLDVFEAFRRDASLTPAADLPVAARPEWMWAAQILTRLLREKAKRGSRLANAYVRAIAEMQLERTSNVADRTSASFAALVAALGLRVTRRSATVIAEHAATLTDEAEAAGCVRLAQIIAGAAVQLCDSASTTAYAKLLTKVARGYRALGDLDEAALLYSQVRTIGKRARNVDALTRGTLGLAVVARERGNYDQAIHKFEAALRFAERGKSRELQIFAHQGLQVVGELTGDFPKWVRHGWLAYTLSIGDAEREIEILHNVAVGAAAAGLVDEALELFSAVLAHRPLSPRMRFHYLRSLAKAGALGGRRDTLDNVLEPLRRLGESTPYAYEYAIALVNVAAAYSFIGEEKLAEALRAEGVAIARRFGLTEVIHVATWAKPTSQFVFHSGTEFGAKREELRRALRTIVARMLDSRVRLGSDVEGPPGKGARA